MALFSGAEISSGGLNENTRCVPFCTAAWDRMLSTKELFPGRGKSLQKDLKDHETWGGAVSFGRMTRAFGLVSVFRMGTCRCGEPLAQDTGA